MVANRNRLEVPIHSARKFTWTNGFRGVADMSDFGGARISSRVYADAVDIGFICESPRTGRRMLFTLVSYVRNYDNELTSETYVSCNNDGIPDTQITLFND
jgi:hypothetical protein